MMRYRISEEDVVQLLSIYDDHLHSLSLGFQTMIEQLDEILLETQSSRLNALINNFCVLFNEEVMENLLKKNIEYWTDTDASITNYLQSIEAGDEIINRAERLESELIERIGALQITRERQVITGQLEINESVFEKSIEVVNKHRADIALSLDEAKIKLNQCIEENMFYIHLKPLLAQLFSVTQNYERALTENIIVFQNIHIENVKQLAIQLNNFNSKIDISIVPAQNLEEENKDQSPIVPIDENTSFPIHNSNENINEQGNHQSEITDNLDQTQSLGDITGGTAEGSSQSNGSLANDLNDSSHRHMEQSNGEFEANIDDIASSGGDAVSSGVVNPEIEMGDVSVSNINHPLEPEQAKEQEKILIDADTLKPDYEAELQRYRQSIDELFQTIPQKKSSEDSEDTLLEPNPTEGPESESSGLSHAVEDYLVKLLEDVNRNEKNQHPVNIEREHSTESRAAHQTDDHSAANPQNTNDSLVDQQTSPPEEQMQQESKEKIISGVSSFEETDQLKPDQPSLSSDESVRRQYEGQGTPNLLQELMMKYMRLSLPLMIILVIIAFVLKLNL